MHVWSDRIEKNLSGLADFNDGKKIGIEQAKREMVINLANNNVSNDIISKSTGLTIEEVKKIIDSINN